MLNIEIKPRLHEKPDPADHWPDPCPCIFDERLIPALVLWDRIRIDEFTGVLRPGGIYPAERWTDFSTAAAGDLLGWAVLIMGRVVESLDGNRIRWIGWDLESPLRDGPERKPDKGGPK